VVPAVPSIQQITVQDPLDPASHAAAISQRYSRTIAGMIEVGTMLINAREQVPDGGWMRMFNENLLGFKWNTAQRFIKMAESEWVHDSALMQRLTGSLPSNYAALAELGCIPRADIERAVNDGIITAETRPSDARKLRRKVEAGVAFNERDATITPYISPQQPDTENNAASDRAECVADIEEDASGNITQFRERFELLLGVRRACAVSPSNDPHIVTVMNAIGGLCGANFADMYDAEHKTGPARLIARDARAVAMYVLHIEMSITQERCAKPFGLDPSAISRMAQRCEEWRSDPLWDQFFDSVTVFAKFLWQTVEEQQHDPLQEKAA